MKNIQLEVDKLELQILVMAVAAYEHHERLQRANRRTRPWPPLTMIEELGHRLCIEWSHVGARERKAVQDKKINRISQQLMNRPVPEAIKKLRRAQ